MEDEKAGGIRGRSARSRLPWNRERESTGRTSPADDLTRYVTPEMRAALDAARRQALQADLLVLADQIRTASAGRSGASPDFRAGVDWTLRWIENTANGLTVRTGPSSER